MTLVFFGGIKFIVVKDERDRFGFRTIHLNSPDGLSVLFATHDIRTNYWFMSNGQIWTVDEVIFKEVV
jgi:hypothetical protein